ncbi:ACP S-malonyltransferase [Lentilactobacillus kisonensis]|uniref:Malonyl CoA-acyl carrier protein transacylase n=1 Tax=Lentilactobacillus kisonensis DSM 19906 = JCM 15041 TaxID=1423766 RepID=A0A0R1NV98_9LACO|nr:ACP S-malonyltransferase [Lentilactobacillus kisonensis]KRL22228.1 hypothetical protein FC98_GL002607 [Lentilactobacillus kisonensis DSM 19906 = JCM 15041]
MKLGYLFSGQGKQFAGMGQDLYRQESVYRQTVEEASEALGMDLNDAAVLDKPVNTQVAIVTMSTGLYRIMAKEGGLPLGVTGLSLGEYSALLAAGGLTFADTLHLVQDRSTYMDQAGKAHPGKMAAVLKTNAAMVDQAIAFGAKQGPIYAANYNTDSQIVIGGSPEGLEAVTDYLHDHGVKRVVPLKMTVASHTPFMQEASDLLADRIQGVDFHKLAFPVISNTTAQPFDMSMIKQTLVAQLIKPTHFADCLTQLTQLGCDTLVELGPGDTLMKFAKKAVDKGHTCHIDSVETLNDFRSKIKLVK